MHPLGEVEFVFVVAPHHPLAKETEPLTNDLIRKYRAVAAADSSRGLVPRTVAILPGQQVLTVADMYQKAEAQKRGLGVGHLPRHLIEADIAAGDLLVKVTEDGASSLHMIYYAWRTRHQGKALNWFKQQMFENEKPVNWFNG